MTGRIACLLGLILLFGCGDEKKQSVKQARQPAGGEKNEYDLTNADAGDDEKTPVDHAYTVFGDVALADEKVPAKGKPPAKPRLRKVIYNGQISLIVEDFDAGQKQLKEVVATHKAQVERSEIVGEPGQPRSGNWTLRVPAADFEAFMDAVAELGEARQRKIDSKDVSDRYYDTEAAALNLEAREKALRKLYDQRQAASNLADVLSIDREIYNVRGQINTQRDQLKRWDNQTAFSTLVLSMHERKGYVPPESPAFKTTLGRAWTGSIEALVATGKGLVVAFVVLAPWLAVLAVLALGIALPLRARIRRSRAKAASAPE